MSYANPDHKQKISLPGAAGAFGVSGACIALIIFAAPQIIGKVPEPPLPSIMPTRSAPKPIPPQDTPPPPPDVFTPQRATDLRQPSAATPIKPLKPDLAPILPPAPAPISPEVIEKPAPEIIPTVADPPKRIPVIVSARYDPRYEDKLQPPYPRALREAGIEGRVTLRVHIGADGRVLRVQMVSADDPAFFEATERHALKNWRFRPETRDGLPSESWRTMTLVFRLEND